MFKWLGSLALALAIAAGILFANRNMEEVAVSLPIPGIPEIPALPLYGIVFAALFLGFVLGALSSWMGGLKYRRQAGKLQKQNKDLEKELTNLRNLPLENDIHP